MKEAATSKRVIEINHALSGIHGEEVKANASRINEIRKEIMKKIDRKKKLSSIIHDELYSYLEKFPEEKTGLHQELKKKKLKLSEYEEKYQYRSVHFTAGGRLSLCRSVEEEGKDILKYMKYAGKESEMREEDGLQ